MQRIGGCVGLLQDDIVDYAVVEAMWLRGELATLEGWLKALGNWSYKVMDETQIPSKTP